MAEGWDNLPFSTQLRLPITAAVPMFFRWKIMQMKLLLNDIKYLRDTLKVPVAHGLYIIVEAEAAELMAQLYDEIERVRKKRGEY